MWPCTTGEMAPPYVHGIIADANDKPFLSAAKISPETSRINEMPLHLQVRCKVKGRAGPAYKNSACICLFPQLENSGIWQENKRGLGLLEREKPHKLICLMFSGHGWVLCMVLQLSAWTLHHFIDGVWCELAQRAQHSWAGSTATPVSVGQSRDFPKTPGLVNIVSSPAHSHQIFSDFHGGLCSSYFQLREKSYIFLISKYEMMVRNFICNATYLFKAAPVLLCAASLQPEDVAMPCWSC